MSDPTLLLCPRSGGAVLRYVRVRVGVWVWVSRVCACAPAMTSICAAEVQPRFALCAAQVSLTNRGTEPLSVKSVLVAPEDPYMNFTLEVLQPVCVAASRCLWLALWRASDRAVA